MDTVENLELLENYLTREQLIGLDAAASRQAELSNMSFAIQSVENKIVNIFTTQADTPSGKYANEATLIKRTTDLFRKIDPALKIIVTAQARLPSPASVVNVLWIEQKMEEKGIRLKQIAFDTGIDRESVAGWVTGKRSMSQIVKAMFYFYFAK